MVIRFGVFEADLVSCELRKQGLKVRLSGQPFQLLAALLEHPGEVVTREELRGRLWPSDTFVDFDRALNKCVNRVREVLGDSAEIPRYIETIPRRGYRWVMPVTRYDPAAEQLPVPADSRSVEEETLPGSTQSWLVLHALWAGVAIALIAVALVAHDVWPRSWSNANSGSSPIRALAILPLDDLSIDSGQEHLADGLTDALITTLASTDQLRVISLSSSLHFKGTKKSIAEISRALDVDAIVQGSVLRHKSRVRINVRLLRTPPETDAWAGSYEGDFDDLLRLEAQVSGDIAREIQIRLSPDLHTQSEHARPAVNPAAYELYLKGRFFWNKRTEAGMQRAARYFEDAIRADPTYASAYAGLADSYLLRNVGMIPRPLLLHGKALAIKALEFDDRLADAHASVGRATLFCDWDWSGAEKEFKRAIQLNPSSVNARHWYGIYLSTLGRHREAQEQFEIGRRLDPLSPVSNLHVGLGRYFAREYETAIREFRNVLDLHPNFVMGYRWLGLAYAGTGSFDEGIRACERAAELGDNWMSVAALGYVQAVAGRRRAALASAKRLIELSKSTYVSPYLIAAIYAGLKEKEIAFAWLDKAYAERSSVIPFLGVHEWFDPLRSEPHFDQIAQSIGLPRQAQSHRSAREQ